MKTTDNGELIALVDKLPAKLFAADYNSPMIEVTIARLGDDGKPRNWRLAYEENKQSTGGCFARIWSSNHDDGKGTFTWHGPNVSHGEIPDYEHGIRAIKIINKRMDSMSASRGPIADAAEAIGRWLEACGVSKVYYSEKQTGWLTDMEWETWNVGRLVAEVRGRLPKIEATSESKVA